MTESEWLLCKEPLRLLRFLMNQLVGYTGADRSTLRKIRLLLTAFGRHFWAFLRHKRSRTAVEVGERFADGLATWNERAAAKKNAKKAYYETLNSNVELFRAHVVCAAHFAARI